MKVIVSNSTCSIEGNIPAQVQEILEVVMTYKNDVEAEIGQLFYTLKKAKQDSNNKLYWATKNKIKHLESIRTVCLYKNNTFPTGLFNIALEALKYTKVDYQLDDRRVAEGPECILRWNTKPFDPRWYQQEAIDAAIAPGRGVIESAVGSGKSLMMAYLIKHFSVKSLVIVPSRGLLDQLSKDFTAWFGVQNVQLLDASKIRTLKSVKPINIVTVQSLASLKKSGEFKDFAKHINAIYVDELHHSGSNSYVSLLEDLDHVYYRYGFTGTFLRNDSKTLEMWSFLSNVVYKYTANQAIKDKFLTPINVKTYKLSGKGHRNYQKEYDNCYSGNVDLLGRLKDICKNHEGQQILILVKKKDKCGLIIHEYLNSLGIDNTYISGDNKKEEITATISAFNDKQIQVLIGSTVISEGIDVRSTDVLANCKGGKSIIDLVQSMGRLIRLYENKEIGHYYDFDFEGTNYMTKHFVERMEAVVDNFSPEKIIEMN